MGTELGKKKGDTSGHRSSHSRQSQDIQEENREKQHRATDSSQQHQQKHSKPTSTTKRRHNREAEIRSKTSSSAVTGSESLSQEHYIEHNHDAKNVDDEPSSFNALSLPPQSSPSDHSSHSNRTNDFNYKTKNSKESHDKRKQHSEAAESGGGGSGISRTSSKQENASSAKEASADTARQDREATPLAASANPKIVVGESDDGEISSGNSTPVPKPGYESFEIDIGVSPATSTSTLTTVGVHSPECNGHGDVNDHHYRHSAKPQFSSEGDIDRVVPKEFRDKYYSKQRHSYNLQPPSHDTKFKQRNSSEFQSLKELEETSSFVRSPNEETYEFSISPAQVNVHELSQVDGFSMGPKKTRTSCGELYNNAENSPPSPRNFLSQSVMELNGQEEVLSQFPERSNLSRMSSEPYLGPPGLQSSVCTAIYENQYPPSNYRYSSGLHYSQSMAPHSGRHGNRSRHPKNRVPGRRHSGESSHHLVAGDKSNSTSSLSQPRRG